MKILLTAFDPFDGETVNPAQEALALVPERIADCAVIKLTVPTVFHKSIRALEQAMEEHRPDAVLCVGQAGGRFDITPERVAINLDDARIPDNEGNQPIDTPIREGAPPAYFSSLPVKAMVEAIRDAGLPGSLSNSAGTFVCNHLMFGLLDLIATRFPGARGGFVHVPFIPRQVARRAVPAPCLSREDIARGLEAAVRAIIGNGAGDTPF